MKTRKLFAIVVIIGIVLCVIPYPKSNICIRISFDEIAGNNCELYYALGDTNAFSGEQRIEAQIDHEKKLVTFRLDADLVDKIRGFRLDFPNEDQMICVKSVYVSSAGTIRHEYKSSSFFSEDNIAGKNGIEGIDLSASRARAYIKTEANDPYIVLNENICRQILSYRSAYRITKAAILGFVLVCLWSYKKNILQSNIIKAESDI